MRIVCTLPNTNNRLFPNLTSHAVKISDTNMLLVQVAAVVIFPSVGSITGRMVVGVGGTSFIA